MKHNLSDDHVKRIASIAFHRKGGSMNNNISQIIHSINTPEALSEIAQAHTLDAYNHKFQDKDGENSFKRHIAIAASMNRGTLQPTPPVDAGQEQV